MMKSKYLLILIAVFIFIYILLNRYAIFPIPTGAGAYKLNKLTGGITIIYGNKEHKVEFQKPIRISDTPKKSRVIPNLFDEE